MNVMIIGNGGREHALAWKFTQSPRVRRVFVAPGNAGSGIDAENVPLKVLDFAGIARFCKENGVDTVVVGPEIPLCAGIVDYLENCNFRVFGPNKAAAALEGSKLFCKKILRDGNVPTADFQSFTDAPTALDYLYNRDDMPCVVKADGLAAGKGVIVCQDRQQAAEAVQEIAADKKFGDAGNSFFIEELLEGQEASVLAITDGKTLAVMPPAQDHKRAYDNDQGPNTGGMGAYSPAPLVTPEVMEIIESRILVPTLHSLNKNGVPFKGILYAGLMIHNGNPKVLEYNVRFGDPECQPLLMRLKTDISLIVDAVIEGRLDEIGNLEWDERPACCVVMASEGYPGDYKKGYIIRGLEEAAKLPDVKVFHSGTALNSAAQIVSAGGRCLSVTALGDSLSDAKLHAYEAVKCIRWDGAWCRKDIADKGIMQ